MNRIIRFKESIFKKIDKLFIRIDKGHLRRTASLKLIPAFEMRRGGKVSYAEWAYVIGVFHTLIEQNSDPNSRILDVGCGTGLLGIAAYNRVISGGSYTGIDVNKNDIEFCQSNFTQGNYDFIHLDTYNATYANDQQKQPVPWSLSNESYDLVTALSVWTHFNESDSRYYINEVSRVLKGDGKAIISFFILDKHYDSFLKNNSAISLHNASSFDWTFNTNAYDSGDWKTTEWAQSPEDAIAISEEGLNSLLQEAGLAIDSYYPGTWKDYPGLYFQDILILKRKMPKIFTIAGMHRSGTSLMANWFHDSKAFLGFDLLEAASSNKKGHFEDVEFLELHKKDLRDKGYHETGLLIEEKDWVFSDENYSIASSLVDKRSSLELWGWKEPRTALYLEQWKKLIPDLKVISVYREPRLVIDSLYRRLKRNKWYYTRNPITRLKWFVDIDHNPKKWYRKFSSIYTYYNKKIIDFHTEYPKDSILINIGDLLTEEGKIRDEIESFLEQKMNFVPFSTVYEKLLMKGKADPLNLPEIESSIEIFGLMEDLKV